MSPAKNTLQTVCVTERVMDTYGFSSHSTPVIIGESPEESVASSIEFEIDSDSTSGVGNTADDRIEQPAPESATNSDKSAIIRLSGELLKAKQSNWEVVDALSSAYDDIRDMRKREERLNNVLGSNIRNYASSEENKWAKGTEIKILTTQLQIRAEELVKARSDIRKLMIDRDKLKEDFLKAKSELTVLSLRDGRKESEMALARSNLRTLTSSLSEANEKLLSMRENAGYLENELNFKRIELERIKEERDALNAALREKEKQLLQLTKKVRELETSNNEFGASLSSKQEELESVRAQEELVLKEVERGIAEEMKTTRARLIEAEARHEQDERTIAELTQRLREWGRQSEAVNAQIREANTKQSAAREQVTQYIEKLERELRNLKNHQQRDISKDHVSPQYAPKPLLSRRKHAGRKLPHVKPPSLTRLNDEMSDFSASDQSSDTISVSDIEVHSGYSRKRSRRSLPLTPSDVEVLTSDGACADAKWSDVIPNIGSQPRRHTLDSGLGDSLRAGSNPRYRGKERSTSCTDVKLDFAADMPRMPCAVYENTARRVTGSPGNNCSLAAKPSSQYTEKLTDRESLTTRQDKERHGKHSDTRKQNEVSLRRYLSVDRLRARKRRVALGLVFRYLDPLELCRLATVCREWRSLSEHPSLWQRVVLEDKEVNNMTLLSISRRCSPLQVLVMKKLRRSSIPPKTERHKNPDTCFTFAGTFTRNLRSMTYISDKFPASTEAFWPLHDCRMLTRLRVPPMSPCDHPYRFNDKSCEAIASHWPGLRSLTLGGPGISLTGLLHIARGCQRLQELELDRVCHVTEDAAYAMCQQGLIGLRCLFFTFTPVSPDAILQFYSACPQLELIAVHVGISDYFTEPRDADCIRMYDHVVFELVNLMEDKTELSRILRIKADYG
ncbi:predicted protein [Nematostella vectensis]|uniref:F-box domain-containing protein n=1 Tax=Nematostella vectensis TaxID=45351 RepID=A7S0M1_NEMVE|nr:predicted protein [Nematostella vectensis]|eukprot:XP_001634760.1 predicted protein [Nematostella vectensis]